VLLTFVVGFLTSFRIEFEQIEERTFVVALWFERENCVGTSCTVIVHALSYRFSIHCAEPKNKHFE
jgi:hypothetical protein